MGTPKESNLETPNSKFEDEDSPFYNYVNSFSPIKTFKPFSVAQTLSSLNFTSPSPVFASPQAVSHKESRFRSQDSLFNHSKDGSASNQVASTGGEEKEKDEKAYGGMDLLTMCDNVKAKSPTPDWETLISATAGLIYATPNESDAYACLLKRASNSGTRLSGGKMPASEPVLNDDVGNNESESVDTLLNLHRGVRRRHLDFETPGNNQQPLSESSSRSVVPSNGLHLNSIPFFCKDNNDCNAYSFSGNIKVGSQTYTSPILHSQPNIVRESETGKDAGQSAEEVAKSSALKLLNSNSPKKKRRKAVQAGEGDSSCKRCNCKKSKCLKLYCECFAAGVYCTEPCSCVDCFNKHIHKNIVLATRKQIESRNPLAFAPKVIRSSDSIIQVNDDASKTPASARHKRGCNCKKSNCLKKYCECYQSGVGCSIDCRCEGCKNTFGRKFGSSFEQDKENQTSGNSGTATTHQYVEFFNSADSNSTPMSSSQFRQPLSQLPISFNNRLLPPQSQIHHGASGSSSLGIYKMRNPDMSMMSHSRNETITEDIYDMSENFTQSPITNMNAVASPNSRRVSYPLLDSSESTPLRRSGERKLLLSIPSFPSLHTI